MDIPGAKVQGVVDGSPVTAGTLFFAAEHPMSKCGIVDQAGQPGSPKFRCAYEVNKSLHPGEPLQFRSLVGVTPEGQMRRGFLYYLERERAQPYRQYLHYNNGSEIGTKYWALMSQGKPGEAKAYRLREQQEWIGAIEAFGTSWPQNAMLPWTVSFTIGDGTMKTWYGSSTKGIPKASGRHNRPRQNTAAAWACGSRPSESNT